MEELISKVVCIDVEPDDYDLLFGSYERDDRFVDYDEVEEDKRLAIYLHSEHIEAYALLKSGDIDYVVFRKDNW